MIKVMADNNQDISALQDAALYYYLSGYKTHDIFKGYADELEVEISGLNATLKSGAAMVYGHHVFTDGKDTLVLPSNEEFYIVIRIDMTSPAGSEGKFQTVSILKNEDILNDGNIYDIPLYKCVSDVSSITSKEDLRNIRERNIVFYED